MGRWLKIVANAYFDAKSNRKKKFRRLEILDFLGIKSEMNHLAPIMSDIGGFFELNLVPRGCLKLLRLSFVQELSEALFSRYDQHYLRHTGGLF